MMTLDKAQLVVKVAVAKAQEIGQPMNIAVVDAGTNLTAFARMDGAGLGSIDIAINKAFTAKAFDISTLSLGQNSQPGDQFFGIHVSNHTRVMIFAGGIPIKENGQIVGTVGGSGVQGQRYDEREPTAAHLTHATGTPVTDNLIAPSVGRPGTSRSGLSPTATRPIPLMARVSPKRMHASVSGRSEYVRTLRKSHVNGKRHHFVNRRAV
jgi:uncharacterized protein GlcG (DUF336 family)